MTQYAGNTSLRTWECYSNEGEPTAIIGSDDSDFGVNIYRNTDGAIIGVVVYETDEYEAIAAVGDVPADEMPTPAPRVDAFSGEKVFAGWTVSAPRLGDKWDFVSLTGISTALARGTFGLKIVTNGDFVGGYFVGGDDADADDADDADDAGAGTVYDIEADEDGDFFGPYDISADGTVVGAPSCGCSFCRPALPGGEPLGRAAPELTR